MSKSRVCVNVQKKGGLKLVDPWVCFEIPRPRLEWPPLPIPPEGPSPEPWITGLEIAPAALRDLQLLATLHNTAALLTESARATVQEVVRAQVGHLNLPEELQVHL
jgi:hypothetical protein